MSQPGIPVVTMRVEGMAHQIKQALLQHELDISAEMQRAVEEMCRPENIQAVVSREVSTVLGQVIHDEVERFYRHGDGRAAVRQAVEEKLRSPGP